MGSQEGCQKGFQEVHPEGALGHDNLALTTDSHSEGLDKKTLGHPPKVGQPKW